MKFTQQLTMHLNGGREFSELHYDILADGKRTNLKRHTRTDGSPRYLKTIDVIYEATKADDPAAQFDMLATRGAGLQEWLEAHVQLTDPQPAA
jgi:hypothetical protein